MKGRSSENHSHLLTDLIGLVLAAIGSYTLAWVGWLTWHDITTWNKSLALIFFGSRTGEAISLGIGMEVIHYFLIGIILLTLSTVLVKGYLGKIIYVVSKRVYAVSLLLLSLHFAFLLLSIKAGEMFGEPFMIKMSVSNILAFVLLSAAVTMLVWKNFYFQASNASIVALFSILLFFIIYTPLHYAFIGYTYTLFVISTTLFTIIGTIAPHIPKRTKKAVPYSGTKKAHSTPRREAIPHAGSGKGSENPLILVPFVTFLVLVEELLLNSTYAGLGLALALLIMLSLPLSGVVLSREDSRMQRFLEISGIVFANRVVLSPFPISFLTSSALLPAIYTLVLIACILYIAYRKLDLNYVGLVKGEMPLLPQILVGLLTGYLLGFIEYFVLRPTPITTMNLTQTLVYLVIVMMVFVGITEELLFRGLLQRSLEEIVPPWQAITIASLIFALMHLGWLNPIEIVFAYTAGTIFGLMFHKTRSLIAPIVTHGFGNVVLYVLVLFF